MENIFGIYFTAIGRMKRILFKELFTVVPSEMKAQFEQVQLKKSLGRLKVLGVITVIFNVLNWPIYILHADEISKTLFNKLFFADSCHFFVTLLFFVMTKIFSEKYSILWTMCYLFVAFNFWLSAYTMLFTEEILSLQIFFTATFIYTFAPDFKPKIFMSFLVVWYLAVCALFTVKNHAFNFGGIQLFALNIFLIALIIKMLTYVSNVKIFINMHKLNTLNKKLEFLSVTDELTKLNNRRSFLNHMDVVWKLNHRLQLPIALLMIDIDYFKKYNDSLGHLEGDKIIISVARCIEGQARRDTDFIARFGGEEFVCILQFLERDDALKFANDLVQKIEDMRIPHPMSGHSKYVTVSIGVASAIPDDHNSPTQLLDDADKALYMAKHAGRNRAVAGWSNDRIQESIAKVLD